MSQLRYVVIDKRVGQTPLEAIQEWKAANPQYANVAASYAGRLDPMASGLLLVLFGDECKKKEQYLGLDKEYDVEILLDVGSDTGDVLGIVELADAETQPSVASIKKILRTELGSHMRAYPVYSSKTVDGTPLFLHALRGTLDTIAIPEHMETVHTIALDSIASISLKELHARVEALLSAAPRSEEASKEAGADFRIHAVRNSWNVVTLQPERSFAVIRLRVICGSGTYMRSLAERVGTALGTKAIALSIHRTRLGTYKKFGPVGFWTRQFRLTID